mgnify:FL=1|tara:strand:+ start:323 stop:715 length:393 start_codon:yes stop_codon:yes gene_type:complete
MDELIDKYKKLNIDNLIRQKLEHREEIEIINKQLKKIKEKDRLLDAILIEKMDAQGLTRTANDMSSVTVKEDSVPEVVDWDVFYEHIQETGEFSLLHRRVSSAAWNESVKIKDVPGVKATQLRKVNLRKL